MPDAMVLAPHIVSNPGVRGGRPCIQGTGISVQNVAIWHERLGLTADEIAFEYDLSLADIHAALAYYFDHQAAIDASIRSDEAYVRQLEADARASGPDGS